MGTPCPPLWGQGALRLSTASFGGLCSVLHHVEKDVVNRNQQPYSISMKSGICPLSIVALLAFGTPAYSATLVDSFSGSLSAAYTLTRVNDVNTASNVSFNTTGGVLNAAYAGANAAEQVVLLRDDFTVGVGQTLSASLSGLSGSGTSGTADIGIVLSSTATPTGSTTSNSTRNGFDWISISVRGLGTGGPLRMNYFTNGGAAGGDTGSVSNSTVGAPATIADIKSIFIKRTSSTSFDVGWVNQSDVSTVLATRVFTGTSVGNSIGFYTDLRADASTIKGLDNLTVIPEPSAALLGAIGALGLLRRRRY
jgi:hypothetical protein